MPVKLTEAEIADLRLDWVQGELPAEIAERYSVSERHVRRLVEGLERDEPGPVDDAGGVLEAAKAWVERLGYLRPEDEVRARAALALARRLDGADARTAAGLAKGLSELLGSIKQSEGPSPLDLIRARRDEQLSAAAAAGGDGAP